MVLPFLSFVNVEAKRILGLSLLRDPYSECVNSDLLKASLASRGQLTPSKQKDSRHETKPEEPVQEIKTVSAPLDTALTAGQSNEGKTLKDAVKPKNKRKKKTSTNNGN